jgi:RimK family alpha-L-glutamate ligase
VHVVILSARSGWHTDQLRHALTERGHTSDLAAYESIVARIGFGSRTGLRIGAGESRTPDAVLARIIPNGSLEQIIFRVDALHWLEDQGIPVINSPRALERSVDKFYTSALLHDAGLPTPETVVCEDFGGAMATIREMGDAIVKPIFGSMGHGLVRVSDPDVAFRVLRPLQQTGAVFYVQRAIDHDGRDIRAFVVGGRVIGAIEREARDGDWRTNVSRGGTARPIDLCDSCRDLAVRAAAAVGADYAGVDILRARDGSLYVLEVNGIPGWQGLQRATGINVAAAIVDHLTCTVQK